MVLNLYQIFSIETSVTEIVVKRDFHFFSIAFKSETHNNKILQSSDTDILVPGTLQKYN